MRRRLIVAVAALVLVAAGWIAVRDVRRGYWTTRGAHVETLSLRSRLVGRTLHPILIVPRGGGRGRELLVFLHGRSSAPASNARQSMFDALHSLGGRAPVVLLAVGGDHSYWHNRRDGAWGSSVLLEQLPLALARSHADPRRVAIGGISMGGFGALDLARLAPRRFCAVGAHSAALWFRGADSAAGAFDDAADFARHDVLRLAAARRLYGMPVWIDVGRADPFAAADTALARDLRAHGTRVRFQLHGGGHSGWSRRFVEYLRWYAGACR
jgi:S-formylglutathione hydrolase FrmB